MNKAALVDDAAKEARRATVMSWVWWVQLPVVLVTYWLISEEAVVEKAILLYLAAVSIIALAVTYAAKAKGSEATQASYENPE